MKILYVEDELKKNTTGAIDLFLKYLDEETIKQLEEKKDDDWASDEDIKLLLEKNGIIDVAYRFPDAVKLVKENYNDYSLYIVDCNLSEQPYRTDELNEVAPEFGKDQQERYSRREGEYLLTILSGKSEFVEEIKSRFYFLSAYSKSSNVLTLIDNGTITENNYVEKGNKETTNWLVKKVINLNEVLNIQIENKEFIQILENHLSEDATSRFVSIIQYSNKNFDNDFENIVSCMTHIRNLMQNICTKIAKTSRAPQDCWNPKNITQLNVRRFIGWISKYNKKGSYILDSNTLIEQHLYTLHGLSSDFASHEELRSDILKLSGFKPTTNTVNSLIFALKDIILWFGEVMEKKDKVV
ncbi:MAG: hypothetical protein JXR48_18385 [Candidatus Delongbacteria bacterium]|nr:hypothetical protein [Candidatus Delongbacteria bacterium]MBN2836929.1 hypothetical protein [Candidatus Delongbacteria bacterium]